MIFLFDVYLKTHIMPMTTETYHDIKRRNCDELRELLNDLDNLCYLCTVHY